VNLPVSIVIPTYRREAVLVDTVRQLLELLHPPSELIVVDQTERHEPATEDALAGWCAAGKIHWIKLAEPSITHAMNVGLSRARNDVVAFVDDDIIPHPDFVLAHHEAHASGKARIVAGQVLQPGEEPTEGAAEFPFTSREPGWISELMGCNFSVNRGLALALGGFDENFVHVAYRFEAEFCDRALSSGERILYEPAASIRHLRAPQGGTRSYGAHLTTVKPSHAVGAYYYLLRARSVRHRAPRMAARLLRSVRTRHHLRHPWWIPGTLIAETLGMLWAVRLALRGPRLIGRGAVLENGE